jgi:tRNA (guanine-N7-)-methyltransferase
MTQRMIEITSPSFIPETLLSSGGGPDRFFDRESPLALEIGCGIGDFIVQLAQRQPETNFLAIDIYNKGCFKTCKKVDASGLKNVRVLRLEARYLMARYLSPGSLSAIYVNCPDPWPKKRHRQRRLVGEDFARMALHYLRPGGDFHFTTDFADYAEAVAEIFLRLPEYRNCLEAPMALSLPGYPLSKYMRRFLDQGLPIHFLHYRKKEGLQLEATYSPALQPGFRVPLDQVENG